MLHVLLALVLAASAHVAAWGNTGHQFTGAIAEALVAPSTRETLLDLLGNSQDANEDGVEWSNDGNRRRHRRRRRQRGNDDERKQQHDTNNALSDDEDKNPESPPHTSAKPKKKSQPRHNDRANYGVLANAAVWADKAKFTKAYGYTRALHYVDTNGDPPRDCSYDHERDCPGGRCITGAIANFTTQLSCRNPERVRRDAAKFLMHFIGDLTQPLHTCERLRGGNDARVIFDGKDSVKRKGDMNLHGIWDYSLLEKGIERDYHGSERHALDALIARARSPELAAKRDEWTACLRTATQSSTALDCAIAWASDSNRVNCETVWKAYEDNPRQDFGGEYFEAAWPIVQEQILKAGVRAAAWFDANLRSCRSA